MASTNLRKVAHDEKIKNRGEKMAEKKADILESLKEQLRKNRQIFPSSKTFWTTI